MSTKKNKRDDKSRSKSNEFNNMPLQMESKHDSSKYTSNGGQPTSWMCNYRSKDIISSKMEVTEPDQIQEDTRLNIKLEEKKTNSSKNFDFDILSPFDINELKNLTNSPTPTRQH